MADEYQIEYEYTDGNTVSLKAATVKVKPVRHNLRVTTRVDGLRVVTDPNQIHNLITCSGMMSGDDVDTLHGVQSGVIDYTGGYPRLKKIYWDGDTFEENVEVALMDSDFDDLGNGWWNAVLRFEEKDQ